MDTTFPTQTNLFQQLGLADDPRAIARFITVHRPLPGHVALWEAAFWSPSQARWLREEIADDANWTGVVDSLAVSLSA